MKHTKDPQAEYQRLMASADKIRRGAGVGTRAQKHNSMVAMRIGRADALEAKARALLPLKGDSK